MQPVDNSRVLSVVSALPVMQHGNRVVESLLHGNVLLKAEPGAGKSTALPLALLLDERINGKIILLEPRRLAARAVAERLAFHLGEKVGGRIGLRMRGETRVSRATRLEVVTEGVLTRLIQADSALDGVALVIFDEYHERSVHADLGLALCLEIQQALNDSLRLLLMSATLDLQDIATQLGDCVEINCEVRQHLVELYYTGESNVPVLQHIASTVVLALDKHEGDVLVFLPGVSEIERTRQILLNRRLNDNVKVLCLHSAVSRSAQQEATCPALDGVRRIILATSLAETSITIDGVRVVVDSGLERRGRIDSSTGASLLETVSASQASATQRAGRAGRTAPGVCYRLWGEEGHRRRSAFWQPEILRADLSTVIMELAIWGVQDYKTMAWTTPPTEASVARARDLLSLLGLWENDQLSARGKAAASLPVHPRLAAMLLWSAEHHCLEMACHLAVILEDHSRSDNNADLEIHMQLELPVHLKRLVQNLMSMVTSSDYFALSKNDAHSKALCNDKPSVAVVLSQAYPDWIAKRRLDDTGAYALACGAGAVIDHDNALAQQPWLVVAQLGGTGHQARIYKAAALDTEELARFTSQMQATVSHVSWDKHQNRVVAESRVMIGTLIVSSKPLLNIDEYDRAKALLDGIRMAGITCLPWSEEARQWQARVKRMQQLDDTPWPDVDDDSLLRTLDQWLSPYLLGLSSLASLQKLDMHQILTSMLDYQQQLKLDQWLPLRFRVPSGSNIRLSYIDSGNPVLSVRLQEMFGCAENPAVACGKLALKVQLLSPARRVVQVTEDIVNFWTNSYPAVKKDMAGRYPKHLWPENPLLAEPTTRAKPRKT